MKLYHGTSLQYLKPILENGLVPRGEGGGNWDKCESNSNSVYLTLAYAGYFAMCACGAREVPWLVLEIETDQLDPDDLCPDEDYLEQSSRGNAGTDAAIIGSTDMVERTKFFRDNIFDYANLFQESLEGLGNAQHVGIIPSDAITRYSVFEPKSNTSMAWTFADPTISLMNYHLLGAKYRAMTQWLMGEDVDPKEIDSFYKHPGAPDELKKRDALLDEMLANRTGLKVREL